MRSVLQDWVMELGLRHQGTLLTAVRGCDTAPKDDASKRLARCLRGVFLNAHCGDAKKAATFIEVVSDAELLARMDAFRKNLDHYPHHYLMHLLHAVQVVGYRHPDQCIAQSWRVLYQSLCRGMHLNPESLRDLDGRLNADEETFARRDSPRLGREFGED